MRSDTHTRMARAIFQSFGEYYKWDAVRMDRCCGGLFNYFGGAEWDRAWESELSAEEKQIYREWLTLSENGDENAIEKLEEFSDAVQDAMEDALISFLESEAGK